ncbi:MAG: lipocalin family protein [Chryseobacterium sp.]|jgi:hypothetical protein|uniref:lipocalin family protein n=1 Tax=Chryseobacterium sp. TaxID=1871047 RepID=UPI00282BC0FF|nr:lipocalin family protein [Chryseobacterium sp.]MDR2237783.1 lipocalin family protein [Chryseobacterium sp.]
MRFFIAIFLIIGFASCDDDKDNEAKLDITGTWKPSKYEFKGKTILLNDCEKKGVIQINTDFSGAYERFISEAVTGNCLQPDSRTGDWSVDNVYSTLTFRYKEEGTPKTLKKEIESVTNTELRVMDNSKNLDDIEGNDEAILVFTKE